MKKFCTEQFSAIIMLTLFMNMKGVLLEHTWKKG